MCICKPLQCAWFAFCRTADRSEEMGVRVQPGWQEVRVLSRKEGNSPFIQTEDTAQALGNQGGQGLPQACHTESHLLQLTWARDWLLIPGVFRLVQK